jgi:hypothetical protein
MEKRIPLDEVMATPEFAALTPKQQAFAALVISLGQLTGNYDAEKAASVAFNTKNGQILGSELMRQSKIVKVLNVHFGKTKQDAMLEDLHRAINRSRRKGKTIDEHLSKAIDFYEKHSGQKIEGVS